METKFTKGEWIIGGYETATVLTKDVIIKQEFKNVLLTEKEMTDISVANANLIAAAPELLKACNRAMIEIMSGTTDQLTINALLDAIKKATR